MLRNQCPPFPVRKDMAASPKADAADSRVIAGVKDRTNRRIDSQNEVGGWPDLTLGAAAKDSDGDGMSDDGEKANSLNADDSSNSNSTQNDGCTNLEHYLNAVPLNDQKI